jgi:hypothetical protein
MAVDTRIQDASLLPVDVMFDNMMYAHTEAEKQARRLRDMSGSVAAMVEEAEEVVDGHEADLLRLRIQVDHVCATLAQYERVQAHRDRSQRYAADLAPYVHPRLSAVAVKNVDPEEVRTRIAVEYVEHDPARVAPPAARPPPVQARRQNEE